MEELQALKDVVDVSGNVALLIAVYYIRENTKADRDVAERLARIESLANINPKTPKE